MLLEERRIARENLKKRKQLQKQIQHHLNLFLLIVAVGLSLWVMVRLLGDQAETIGTIIIQPVSGLILTLFPVIGRFVRNASFGSPYISVALVLSILLSGSALSQTFRPEMVTSPANVANREVLVILADFDQKSGSQLDPDGEWEIVLNEAIREINDAQQVRLTRVPQVVYSHDEARALSERYQATLVIWGRVRTQDRSLESYYTTTPRWSFIDIQPGDTEVHGTVDEISNVVGPGKDSQFVLNFVLGQLYYFDAQLEEALHFLNQAILLAPDGREQEMGLFAMHFYRGLIHQRLSLAPINEIIADYSKVIELNPDFVLAHGNRGTMYKTQGNLELALADYTRALELNSSHPISDFCLCVFLTSRGDIYYQLDQYENALKDLQAAVAIEDTAERQFRLGNIQVARGDFDSAITAFQQALVLDPDYALAYTGLGATYLWLSNNTEASHNYSLAASEFASQKDYDNAVLWYSRALEIQPRATWYGYRGDAHYYLENYQAALNDYNLSIELDPQYARAYVDRGHVYHSWQRYSEAIADYDTAIRIDPIYIRAYESRASAFIAQKNYPAAIEDRTTIITLSPHAQRYIDRAEVYEMMEDDDHAIADYSTAIELDASLSLYVQRANIYHNIKDYDHAISDYLMAREIEPSAASPYVGLGNVYYDQGNPIKALEYYELYMERVREMPSEFVVERIKELNNILKAPGHIPES